MAPVLFLPFFTGIGTPYWNSDAKAAILGLSRGTSDAHIALACLEGIALSVNDSVSSFKKDFAHLNDIKVDGGACANNLLMQLQSNFSQKKILRPQVIDTTAYGVALGAMVGRKELALNDLSQFWKLEKEFSPNTEPYFYVKKEFWNKTIQKFFT
jgi:glycerol kinase